MADNTIVLVGNVTREPELRYTAGGQAVTKFGLAVNRRWQQAGEWKEQVSFFDVVCWGQLGENVATSIGKGNRAVVTGRLEQRSYETREGEKRNAVEVVADEVAPSLKWATAQIDRNERTDRTTNQAPAQRGNSNGNQRYAADEEPF